MEIAIEDLSEQEAMKEDNIPPKEEVVLHAQVETSPEKNDSTENLEGSVMEVEPQISEPEPEPVLKEPEPPAPPKKENPQPEVNLKVLKKKVQSLEWMVSNAVFEYEQKRLTQLVSKLKAERKPHDEEETRITLISVKVSDIVFRIEAGLLTIENYTEQVQKKITEERETAKIFATSGDMETARGCLSRAKIMEKELAGEI